MFNGSEIKYLFYYLNKQFSKIDINYMDYNIVFWINYNDFFNLFKIYKQSIIILNFFEKFDKILHKGWY